MKKIYVKVDTVAKYIEVKRGLFGAVIGYSGGWYTDHSIDEVVADFIKKEREN